MSSGPILVEIQDRHVREALGTLARRLEHSAGLMAQIGEALVDATKHRFTTSMSSTGARWVPNRAVTVTRYIQNEVSLWTQDADFEGLEGVRYVART